MSIGILGPCGVVSPVTSFDVSGFLGVGVTSAHMPTPVLKPGLWQVVAVTSGLVGLDPCPSCTVDNPLYPECWGLSLAWVSLGPPSEVRFVFPCAIYDNTDPVNPVPVCCQPYFCTVNDATGPPDGSGDCSNTSDQITRPGTYCVCSDAMSYFDFYLNRHGPPDDVSWTIGVELIGTWLHA